MGVGRQGRSGCSRQHLSLRQSSFSFEGLSIWPKTLPDLSHHSHFLSGYFPSLIQDLLYLSSSHFMNHWRFQCSYRGPIKHPNLHSLTTSDFPLDSLWLPLPVPATQSDLVIICNASTRWLLHDLPTVSSFSFPFWTPWEFQFLPVGSQFLNFSPSLPRLKPFVPSFIHSAEGHHS